MKQLADSIMLTFFLLMGRRHNRMLKHRSWSLGAR